jgi:hypothetical protein
MWKENTMPQIDKRQQPKTKEDAVKAYPVVGTRIVTIGGTYPKREGTVIGLTDKTAQTGWLFLLEVLLEGGKHESSWPLEINGKERIITQPFNVKAQWVRLMPGSWEVLPDQTEYVPTKEDYEEWGLTTDAHYKDAVSRKTIVGDDGETAEDESDEDNTDGESDES